MDALYCQSRIEEITEYGTCLPEYVTKDDAVRNSAAEMAQKPFLQCFL